MNPHRKAKALIVSSAALSLFAVISEAHGGARTSPPLLLSQDVASVQKPESFGLLISPQVIRPGARVWVLAAFEAGYRDISISLKGPDGSPDAVKTRRGGGPPFWQAAAFPIGLSGRYTIAIKKDGQAVQTVELDVPTPPPAAKSTHGAWGSERGWTRADENLYAAWLEALFQDSDERASWPSLHQAVDDPERNVLFNRLGRGEDIQGGPNLVEMTPDCADNPFFLRAYFAWKTGLPFGFHDVTWGSIEAAPSGLHWLTNESFAGAGDPVLSFRRMLPAVKNTVHAGNGRTAFRSEESDYYPLPLARKDLRPGTVFADPYGHTLTIVRWVPQTAKSPGLLLAVDAQPDGTIGIKRFWRGNFLFNTKEVVGEPGFKAFRPIAVENGRLRLFRNDEISQSPDYGNFSLEQEKMASEAFYAAMERLINPDPLDAESALQDLFQALHEQLVVRVGSVANGDAYMKAHPGTVIPMPGGGAAVFQTTGPWEDFSTPNRDLRLLIAIDTLLDFPDKVGRNPSAFKVPARKTAEALAAGLRELQLNWARRLTITYARSDGSPQVLTLEDIFKRKQAFEMGYNPNDGPEVRWGAPEGSPELSTCRRRAPAYQMERMKAMRLWFEKRLHPPT